MGEKKANRKTPPTRRDTSSIGHFQHSRKTLLVSWPKRVSQEFRSKNYKESPTYAAKQKIIKYRPSSSYNPGQNYLRICTPPCTLSNATTRFAVPNPPPPGQCCFLQMSKDQGCFRTHNNIASKGRGEGRTRYSEDVRKNALRMWHFLNSFVQDCRYGTTPVVAESQLKFNSILRYRVACSFCESFILRFANKTPVETCLRELIFSIVKIWFIVGD